MNRAIIIARYALTLVKYVQETGGGPVVASEAETLFRTLHKVPDLQTMMEASDDIVSPFDKKKLLQDALGDRLSPELSRFITLLNRNGRMGLAQEIFRDFVTLYYRCIGVRQASLVTAREPSERLLQRLKALVKEKTGDDVIIHVTVDPTLIGGFVFDIDEYLMDASVKHQLDLIRTQFIQKNRRII